jgi:hypothetical protein
MVSPLLVVSVFSLRSALTTSVLSFNSIPEKKRLIRRARNLDARATWQLQKVLALARLNLAAKTPVHSFKLEGTRFFSILPLKTVHLSVNCC